jgi:flagellar hook-associated protein 2
MTTTNATSSTDISTLLAQAAQSIISGSTKSSLDVNSLVSSLVTAKTIGQSTTISNKQSVDTTELSAVAQLKSALSSLQTALSGLADGTALSSFTTTASGTGGITATTSTGAVAGNYAINVTSVAAANKISSQAFTSSSTIGSGTLTVSVGSSGTPMNLTVTSGMSLSDIATAINKSANNPGVSASVITSQNGQHLVVTSNATGAANTVGITTSGSLNANLASSTFTQVTAGADAVLSIDGNTVQSSSNTISNALSGVTITLSAAASTAPNNSQTLTIANDTTSSTKAITAVATAYNSYITAEKRLSSYDSTAASGSQAGPLLGDAMLLGLNGGLADLVSGGVSSGGKTYSLSSIGLDLQPDGTITVDSTKLSNAVTSNDPAVAALFNTTNGIGRTMNSFVTTYTQTNGILDTRTAALTADQKDLTDQATQLQAYQDSLTAQYNAQFTALNTLMTQTQNNTTYLNQLFGGNGSSGTLNSKA